MSNELFDDFEAVSSKQWKQKIQFDLNGTDYNNALVWKSNEGISVKPFYPPEDLNAFKEISNPNLDPWRICQSIYVADVEKSNSNALFAIENGADSIKFIIPSDAVSIESLLKDIDLNVVHLHFELLFLSETYIELLSNISGKPKVYVHTDIIGNLAQNGNWFHNLKNDFSSFESIVKRTRLFGVNAILYQNAGANMVQQLAYALAHANEYLVYLKNVNADEELKKPYFQVIFNVSIGSNHFFEIAKLRALRLLWKTLVSKYSMNTDCHIIATPTKRNKTLYDHNINMLRTTTEYMSAILGGADTVCSMPYDAFYHKSNAFGERISRNQLLILKHESHFDKVNNPADGTYYIEHLTLQLAEKSLELFKDIESNGGFLKQLKEGTIQRKIKESASKEQKQFDSGEEILVGTNKYQNPNDKMAHELELYPFVKTNPRKTLIEPIIEKRLSETLEQKRLKNEN
jgi:methylmalonyl-CoA mutase